MADNYTLFSEVITCKSMEESNWLLEAIQTDKTEWGDQCCQAEQQGTDLWIYSEDNCDLEMLAGILMEFQKKFEVKEAIIVSWAYTCSKPRAGEFGGGAFLIQGGKDKWIDARSSLQIP